MGYLNNKLQNGETVVYTAKIHWFLFLQPILLLLLGYFFYLSREGITYWLGVVILFLGLVALVQRLFIKVGSVYAVTNKRVILKIGVLSHRQLDLVLTKCEGLQVKQSIFGRIFNFGNLLVTTGGVINTFHFVSNPFQFKREIDQQIQ